MLEILLKESYEGEDSPLLANNYKGWIKSITTISTPHNGTTLVPIMLDVFPFSLNLAPWFGSIDNKAIDQLYSFDLEHWGLEKRFDESFDSFVSRLLESELNNPKNLCSWELSVEGANEFNQLYEEDIGVYYFSFITTATKQKNNSLSHKPDSVMSLHLWPTSLLMGNYRDVIDSSWYENDGVVNSVSMSHPFGSNRLYFDGTPITGVWQSLDAINADHQSIIGHGVSKKENINIFALYKNHCSLLYKLE
jgi:triacylglycerol lipase